MSRFTEYGEERPKGTVELDAVECYSLLQGFEWNPEAAKTLKEAFGDDRVELFKEVMRNTGHLAFLPSEEMKIVYHTIASVELKRLRGLEADATQKEEVRQDARKHINALEVVIEKFPVQVQ